MYLNGVTLKQEHIQAYRLILEVVEIKKIPDPIAQGVALQIWIDDAERFVEAINPSCSHPALNLVKIESRQLLQSCDDSSHSA